MIRPGGKKEDWNKVFKEALQRIVAVNKALKDK